MSGSTTPTTFNYSGGFAAYTVPATGLYDVTAYGAQGGSGFDGTVGGKGAEVGGDIMLTKGEVLTIDVGGAGGSGEGPGGAGGGGGGGSFVVGPNDAPIVIAGGGGGGAIANGDGGHTVTAGGAGSGDGAGAGGKGGTGGFAGIEPGKGNPPGGGGGGFRSDGESAHALPGVFVNAAVLGGGGGGYPGLSGGSGGFEAGTKGGNGGFGGGGGGGSATGGGGGGGGYSGGGGGGFGGGETFGGGAGGGGGSFDSGTDQVLIPGENSGNGKVVITPAVSATTDPSADPPATAPDSATATAGQASVTPSTLGQPSTPSFIAADPPAQQAPTATADPPQPTSSIVLQPGRVDQLTGFDPHTEVLDLHQALAASHLTLGGDYGKLGACVQVTDSGNDATLSFNPRGLASGPGSPLAVLHGVGPGVTLGTLINDHALAIT
jgi:hypothetical protein